MKDPFAWDPAGPKEPWFEQTGPLHMRPITRKGRVVLWSTILGMLASIPLTLIAGYSGAHVALIVAVLVACFVGAPAWFLWQACGRVKV